ncbi:hypothetical protein AX15_007611 [Amanita polypyramis BW_CC]|nr:hypothetical protein AX15_007611 [Amanita polypyramis BW_CC]
MSPKSTPAPSRNGSSKPKRQQPASPSTDAPAAAATRPLNYAAGVRPDKQAYEEEQNRIKADIDGVQAKLSAVREKISLTTNSDWGNDRDAELRAELNEIKGQQSSSKMSRSQTMERIKALQENIHKKVKDLQAARSKTSFKTVEDVDTHIKKLDKQVESGTMKLADEKRALLEISNSKRARRAVEGFQGEQDKIEEERRTVEELKKQLDDPQAKALSDRYDTIIAELDTMKAERDEANANRSKLYEERDSLQAELNGLYGEKRESLQRFREANDHYWAKVNEDRARREERRRTQKAAEEQQKKKDIADRMLEEARIPAFQTEIEDCQTLIDHFSGKAPNPETSKSDIPQKAQLAGVPQLELRKVEGAPEGVVVRKKGEEEESYFVGGKGKGRGKKNTQKANGEASGTGSPTTASASLHVPLSVLSALGSLSIPGPTSSAEVPRVIEDLKTKKLWLEANQARVTVERIEKAEAEVRRLMDLPRESPAEPVPTPEADGSMQGSGLTDEVVDKLDIILEHEVVTETS